MKTQISSLINGSPKTERNENHPKYSGLIKQVCHGGLSYTGTPTEDRLAVANSVIAENPTGMAVKVRGVELYLAKETSLSGKTTTYVSEVSEEQFKQLTGYGNTRPSKTPSYFVTIYGTMEVEAYMSSHLAGNNYDIYGSKVLGEEFVEIL